MFSLILDKGQVTRYFFRISSVMYPVCWNDSNAGPESKATCFREDFFFSVACICLYVDLSSFDTTYTVIKRPNNHCDLCVIVCFAK